MQEPYSPHDRQEYSDYQGYAAYTERQKPPERPFTQGSVYEQPYFSTPIATTGDGRLAAALSYSLGWFSGLLFLLFAKQNPFVRFHAWQSMVFFATVNVLDFGLAFALSHRMFHIVIHFFPFVGIVTFLGFMLINAIAFVAWIVSMVQAGRGAYYQLPFVGNFMAKYYNSQVLPR